MAEKGGDGGQDSVSLPPTYAPSEAYTESPPPAYRGGRQPTGKLVQIVRLLCVTAVVLAVLIGFFVLSTNYLKARTCTCEPRHLDTEDARESLLQAGFLQPLFPPSAQPLVREEEEEGRKREEEEEGRQREEEMKENSLDGVNDAMLGDDLKQQQQQQQQQQENVAQLNTLLQEVEEEEEQQLEEEMRREEEEEEEEEEALQDILQAQEENRKKIRLPLDMILGKNPALAGKEVSCEVERRQIPVAPGIISQTIFVTCKDNNNNNNDNDNNNDFRGGVAPFPLPPRPLRPRQGPPMSLLAPIMKMLASRSGPQPRLVPLSTGGPIPILKQTPRFISGRNSPFSSITKARMTPVAIRGPVSMFIPRPQVQDGPVDRMLPRNLQPIVRISPRVIVPPRSDAPSPVSLLGLQRGAMPIPQPRPRAPPRPVSLSASAFPPRPLPPVFLPFNGIPDPQGRREHDPRPATHMEITGPRHTKSPPGMDFGPPRGHTLITSPPAGPQNPPHGPVNLPRTIRIHTLPRGPVSLPHPKDQPPQAPHPPSFNPEPLRAPAPPVVNPEAEVIAPPQGDDAPPAGHRKHHLLMVN